MYLTILTHTRRLGPSLACTHVIPYLPLRVRVGYRAVRCPVRTGQPPAAV